MRIHQFLAFIGAATLSLSALADPSVAGTLAVAGTAHNGAQPTYHLDRNDARHMRGTYLLDDGRTVVIVNEGGKLFADLDGKREELVRVDWAKFESRDSGARLSFNRIPYADEVVVNQAAR